MKLKIYRNLWGMCGPRRELIGKLEEAGYDGIEAVLFSDDEARELEQILPGRRLLFKAVLWPTGRSVEEQLGSFRAQLTRALSLEPASISVIGGYDSWTDDEAARYFEEVLKLEYQTGLAFSHETHRNSILFHPGITLRLLKKFPELKLVCDFSHWVVTCERLLDEDKEGIRVCGRHATHIHVRVGTEQTPQVADIRAPEVEPYLRRFERWWEIVWDEQAARGLAVTSLCPELGPPPYQATFPYTGLPIADLTAQIEWQRRRQAEHFALWAVRNERERAVAP
jgi:sugar phosphate isomerase/epimerase